MAKRFRPTKTELSTILNGLPWEKEYSHKHTPESLCHCYCLRVWNDLLRIYVRDHSGPKPSLQITVAGRSTPDPVYGTVKTGSSKSEDIKWLRMAYASQGKTPPAFLQEEDE